MRYYELYLMDKATRLAFCQAVRHERYGSRVGQQYAAKQKRRAKRKATGR